MRSAKTLLELIRERGKKGLPLERVYTFLFNKDLYLMAYGKISRNDGTMTHGVTDETPDGMSLEKIDAIIEALRYERYQWLPARRVYLPKKKGKKRPLGMPVWSDKLVQEVIRLILEAYLEPQCSNPSPGFRPERGCHTALREVYRNWKGTTWFLEGEISQCFDKLSHERLLNELSEKIQDGRFLNLMRELLEAGYMEDWTFNETLSGVPQGGIVSPILSNILLSQLDRYVETVLLPQYTKGEKRGVNLESKRLMVSSRHYRQRGKTEKAEDLRKQAQQLPTQDVNDPHYRRLKYVRYADDFLLGLSGPKSGADEIKQQLGTFLQEELKLELSKTKTLITHARTGAARFLGYQVTNRQVNEKRTVRKTSEGMRTKCRTVNGQIGLQVPKDVIEPPCKGYMRGEKAIHRAELINESDFSIITRYQSEFRGMANYSRLAYNMHTLIKLKWVMETSLTKTLAAKLKVSVTKIDEKYGAKLEVKGEEYKGLQVSRPRPEKKPLIATWGGVPLSWDIQATLEEQPKKKWKGNRSELEQRLLADFCELCGDTQKVEVHHVRKMSHLHEHPGRPKPPWVRRMIALQRKTLLLCRTCHEDVDLGRPLRRQSIELTEVKALRKRAKTRILESHVQ